MSNSKNSHRRNRHFGMEVLETRKLAANFGFAQVDTQSDQPEQIEAAAEVSSLRAKCGVDTTSKVDGKSGGGVSQLVQSRHHQNDNVFPGDGSTGALEPAAVDAAIQHVDFHTVFNDSFGGNSSIGQLG